MSATTRHIMRFGAALLGIATVALLLILSAVGFDWAVVVLVVMFVAAVILALLFSVWELTE